MIIILYLFVYTIGGPIKELTIFDPSVPGLVKPVHLIGDFLVWPVVFLYPEYKTSDMIQEFNETTMSVYYFYFLFFTFIFLLHFNI